MIEEDINASDSNETEIQINMPYLILYDTDTEKDQINDLNSEPKSENYLSTIKTLINNNEPIYAIAEKLEKCTRYEYGAETILECAMNNNRLDVMRLIIKTDIQYITNKNEFGKNAVEFAFNATEAMHNLFFKTLTELDIPDKVFASLFHKTKPYINSKLISVFQTANKPKSAAVIIKAEIDYLQNEFEFSSPELKKGAAIQINELQKELNHINRMIALDEKYFHKTSITLPNEIDSLVEIIGNIDFLF